MKRILFIALTIILCSCDENGENDITYVALVDLSCDTHDETRRTWESSPYPDPDTEDCEETCQWIALPKNSILDFEHPLGVRPHVVHIDIAFDPCGRSASPASGDPARILGANTEAIRLRNTTDQSFYVRVAAQ